MNYYNEFDPKAAAWLRELIARGLIPPGVVDERSIEDVKPNELTEYTQCHFFAGIGGWSLALQLAGWPTDRQVWTGSCPCQPFSAAGKGAGFADERHLWPAFFHLIEQCRPAAVFGEQVASRDGLNWLDLVCADLESADYAVGAADLCAAGVGAPHIRQRLYWVANSNGSAGRQGRADIRGWTVGSDAQPRAGLGSSRVSDWVANARGKGSLPSAQRGIHRSEEGPRSRDGQPQRPSSAVRLADTNSRDAAEHAREWSRSGSAEGARASGELEGCSSLSSARSADPLHGFWAGADWLGCRDGKLRPVEPGSCPLVDGLPARMAALRGYGNAIVPEVAAKFIAATM